MTRKYTRRKVTTPVVEEFSILEWLGRVVPQVLAFLWVALVFVTKILLGFLAGVLFGMLFLSGGRRD